MTNDFVIRTAQDADLPFVFDSWLNNYQANSYFSKRIPKKKFMKYHSLVLNLMFDRPNTIIKIASDADFTIFGYICAEDVKSDLPVVHYIYVRPEYQKLGIGRALFESLELPVTFEISHWTPVMNVLEKKFPQMSYVPYRA